MGASEPSGPAVSARRILPAVCVASPSLTRGPDGPIVAWVEAEGRIFVAADDQHYRIVPLNPSWQTFDTPALIHAPGWARSFLAWRAALGGILLGHSGDDWTAARMVADAGATFQAPALAFDGARLFIAWTDPHGDVLVDTCDRDGRPAGIRTRIPAAPRAQRFPAGGLISRPSMTAQHGALYVMTGGEPDSDIERGMRVHLSTDGGLTFTPVAMRPGNAIGPPSMAILNGRHHLVWADGDPERPHLHVAQAASLADYRGTMLHQGCHEGPALIVDGGDLVIAIRYGAPLGDELAGRVTLVRLPLTSLTS